MENSIASHLKKNISQNLIDLLPHKIVLFICEEGWKQPEHYIENDVDAVARMESFRALKLTLFESFRALKFSTLFEYFRTLKVTILESFRALQLSLLEDFRVLKIKNPI